MSLNVESIREINDSDKLQEICISLIRIRTKESASKNKYKSTCIELKKALKEREMELSCANQKNVSLQELLNTQTPRESEDLEALKMKTGVLQAMLDDQNKQNCEIEAKCKEQQQKIIEMESNHSAETQKMNQRIEELEMTNAQHEAFISALNKKETVQENTEKSEKSEKENLEGEKESSEQENEDVDESNKEKEETNEEGFEFQQIIETMRNQIKELTEKSNGFENSLLEQTTQCKLLENERNELLAKAKEDEERIKELKEEIEKMSTEKEEKQKEIEETKSVLSDANEKTENQKKVIERMTEEQTKLVQLIETNNTKAKSQISQLKLKLQTLTDQMKRSSDENLEDKNELEKEKAKLNEEISKLKADLEEKCKENAEKEEKINTSNEENSKQKDEIEELNGKLSDKIDQLDQTSFHYQKLKTEHSKLEEDISEVRQKFLTLQEENNGVKNSIENMETIIKGKDETIAKLKILLGRSLKVENRSQETIQELNKEVLGLHTKIANLSVSSGDEKRIEELEEANCSLKEQLQEALQNQESVQKNTKLTQLLEKSNKMYLELQQENQRLLENSKRYSFCNKIEHILNNDVSISPEKRKSPKENPEVMSEKMVKITYLRRVLLQFFTDEESNRETLIPMILDLVGCKKEQANAIMRQYSRSKSFINRTSSVLGY